MASINGTDGNDILIGTSDSDTIFGKGGNDAITARAGRDTITGGAGNDAIDGGESAGELPSMISASRKAASEYGIYARLATAPTGLPTEYLRFADKILDAKTLATVGEITTNAAGGNDLVLTDASALDESLGTDAVDSVTYSRDATIVLPQNIENATLTGAANSSVTGNDLANILIGDAGNNSLFAGAGDDTANGEGGNDTLVADSGAGDDTYIGGEGLDTSRTIARASGSRST